MTIASGILARQRYDNAITKARLIARRNLQAFLAGEAMDTGRPGFDIERDCVIAEFQRLQEEIAMLRRQLDRPMFGDTGPAGRLGMRSVAEEQRDLNERWSRAEARYSALRGEWP